MRKKKEVRAKVPTVRVKDVLTGENKTRSQIVSELLSAPGARVYAGKFVRTNLGVKGGFNRLMVGGVVLSPEKQDDISNEWELVDCDVIIVPKKVQVPNIGWGKNARIDQMIMGIGDDKNWKDKE